MRGSGTPSPAEPEANKTKAVSDHIEVAQSDVLSLNEQELTQGVAVSGSLRAVQSAWVKARVAGELQEFRVREGDSVKAGAGLIVVDAPDMALARSDVQKARADETQKRKKGEEEEVFVQRMMPADALRIRGRHNATNALAALALACAAGCPLAPMLYGLREYRGEPHRVEPVAIVNDVEYFDDSKGTNVGATVAALNGLDKRVVLIAGGEGKGQDFSPLTTPVAQYARAVVLIGKDAGAIREALGATGSQIVDAASLEDAVEKSASLAQSGDVVLLSPACASLDMFRNYVHRAQVFRSAVEELALSRGIMP